jgi:NADH:ubiquinone oxidoreductase subunit E
MELIMEDFSYLKKIPQERSNLIKGLQTIQEHTGYISDEAIAETANYFSVPLVEVEGVVSFYAQFKRTKPGKYQIAICDGTACHIKGSSLIIDWISTELGINDGETDEEGLFSMETVACLGCCSLAPVMSINGKVFGKLDRKQTIKILKEYRKNG